MGRYVSGLEELDRSQVAVVGGKAAHLGELSRIGGTSVPAGYCVTTDAYRRIVADAAAIDESLYRLSHLDARDREAVSALSAEIRDTIAATVVPDDLAAAITAPLARLGEHAAYAVRSSATAEDLPTASFAGQQDTYLNVVGRAAILEHVRRCWASLFTERAVTYRRRNGLDHREAQMAVVVQRMVLPRAAGIMFTADPVTSRRGVTSVEATFGLGEALVSGLVDADTFEVRDGGLVATRIATKPSAVHPSSDGGTERRPIEPERQQQPALTETEVVQLAQLGRRIEAHFGHPQDVEWCLDEDGFHIVQSRPITTVFPIPEVDDDEDHVYVSVGHQQMMTDPMKPLGLSVWRLTSPAPMREAGGRLFVDVTAALASPAARAAIVTGLGRSDPLIGDALRIVLDRGDVVRSVADEGPAAPPDASRVGGGGPAPIETDPAIVAELIDASRASLATLQRDIQALSGAALLDFVVTDLQEVLRGTLFDPRSLQVITAAMEATWWLDEHLETWLGERNAADTLTRSAPNNVTSQMGLALLDVADVIRPHPEVVAFLEEARSDGFLDDLPTLAGGREARDAIRTYLDAYGVRCVGEIDITRPRWREHPTALLPVLLGNVETFEPGEGPRRFERGRQEALEKRQEVLERLRSSPDGERRAEETERMIDRVRAFIGYREYPKYHMVSRYFVHKQALLREAARLVRDRVLGDEADIFYLTLEEMQDVVRTGRADDQLIRRRAEAFQSYRALTPPRVLTSDGETIAGAYRRDDAPAGALVGLAVSGGTVEGRARVVLDVADADLEPGDILVTVATDPSWTPVFVAAAGLVTEVGGLMTHGAVVAREYGLPAVVGVEHATQRIGDGQRIRVHGTDGYVELLP
jgi:rifampicin phosphotransferase